MQNGPGPGGQSSPVSHAFEDRRLRRAVAHVNALWFPANPAAIEKIRKSMEEGRYDFGIEFLLDDLKQDLSLYLYCLRELTVRMKAEGSSPMIASPAGFLKEAGLARIREVLDVAAGQISEHDLESSAPFQARQFEASVISAATAELLAEETSGSPEQAHLTALVRHLGYTLISWNYPSAFEAAMQEVTKGKRLDVALSEALGFSPSSLAVAVVSEWGFSPEMRAALDESGDSANKPDELQGNAAKAGYHLSQLCKVGEALARANRPEFYPSAASDWELVRNELEKRVGLSALERIAEHVKEYCTEYSKAHPQLFQEATELHPERRIAHHSEQQLLQKNPFAQQCDPPLRTRLRLLYEMRAQKAEAQKLLEFLVKNVLPLCGFTATVVFTLDADQLVLRPRLKVGGPAGPLDQPVAVSPAGALPHIVTRAFQQHEVLQEELQDGSIALAGKLGSGEGLGVVYSEAQVSFDLQPERSLSKFKALRQAFNDAFERG